MGLFDSIKCVKDIIRCAFIDLGLWSDSIDYKAYKKITFKTVTSLNFLYIFILKVIVSSVMLLVFLSVPWILSTFVEVTSYFDEFLKYGLVGVGGAIAYDIFKKILYSSDAQFMKFVVNLFILLLLLIPIFGSPFIAYGLHDTQFPDWIISLLLIIPLLLTWVAVNRATSAIESFRDTPKLADEIKTSKE